LLTEELSYSEQWPTQSDLCDNDSTSHKTPHYDNERLLDEPLRLFDLIPRSRWRFLLLFCLGVLMLAGVEAAYYWLPGNLENNGPALPCFDLNSKQSLANWFATLTLFAATATAGILYSIRRYRTDDYQGRYRVWLWAAATWFLMATDQATTLRESFRTLMIHVTGSRLLGDGSIWWISLYVLVFGAIGSRLVMDMRPNWFAVTSLLLSGVAWGLATSMQLGWTWFALNKYQLMTRYGIETAGHLFLLTAMGLHARYVVLDALGLLPEPEVEKDIEDAEEDIEAEELDDTWHKIDAPHKSPQPVLRRTEPAPSSSSNSSKGEWSPINRKLTKDEKRALKARIQRERAERGV
jgi:hypothetical protein